MDDARQRLAEVGYLTDDRLATTAYLQSALGKPLLLEGPAGVGKTQLAQSIAAATGRRLLRLQCYEGQDETKALYEWDYGKQLLYTQILREKIGQVVADAPDLPSAVERIADQDSIFFSERFLAPRPLLEAVQSPEPVVLLIDEVDRADEALEAVLLELLAEYQVSVPEIGTFVATGTPLVLLTSNNTRDLSAALKRRCLHLFLDYPGAERELEIIRSKDTGLPDAVAEHLVQVVRGLRELDLRKAPSISETIDWARTLAVLGVQELSAQVLADTMNVVMKYERDLQVATGRVAQLVDPNASVPDDSAEPVARSRSSATPAAGPTRAPGQTAPAPRRAPAEDPDPQGKQVRASKDEPGRHEEAYFGSTSSRSDGLRRTAVAPGQGERSFAAGRAKRRGR
ncbi:AAA family ATPase [Dermacoccaceae bacterium W4C1]